jgi:hypothetical protein
VDVQMRNTISRVVEGETRGKIPMLCVMVKQLTLSDTDASALLVDPTGQMKGTLHRRVFDTYSAEDLAVGAVIVLKQVGPLLCASPTHPPTHPPAHPSIHPRCTSRKP